MKKTMFAAVLLSLLLAPTARAADDLKVIGDVSCAQWNRGASASDKSWYLGFLSGLNWGRSSPQPNDAMHRYNALRRLPSTNYAIEYANQHCRARPGADVSGAALKLQLELQDLQR